VTVGERADITDRDDCERLVRAFYGRAMNDAILGFLFVDVARLDLESHVPRITDFWETILLGAQRYSGGASVPTLSSTPRRRCAPATSSAGCTCGA